MFVVTNGTGTFISITLPYRNARRILLEFGIIYGNNVFLASSMQFSHVFHAVLTCVPRNFLTSSLILYDVQIFTILYCTALY